MFWPRHHGLYYPCSGVNRALLVSATFSTKGTLNVALKHGRVLRVCIVFFFGAFCMCWRHIRRVRRAPLKSNATMKHCIAYLVRIPRDAAQQRTKTALYRILCVKDDVGSMFTSGTVTRILIQDNEIINAQE